MKVVFDTNVVASASFWQGSPFRCLAAWANGYCKAVVSPALLSEYHETIEELYREYPNRAFVNWVEALTKTATLVFPVYRVTHVTSDPADEMVIECALAGEADIIVSGDKKHLLILKQFEDIAIVSPSEFIKRVPDRA
ncbi:MAG: putative toxin-antitoxin system toxin component, PIN family [Deltaproteobacteria bacterium]|nr:putative toxin-antitoxin system toxin component, PIN family [Deltaproteobacteria bacterium]